MTLVQAPPRTPPFFFVIDALKEVGAVAFCAVPVSSVGGERENKIEYLVMSCHISFYRFPSEFS